jgi:hypothetical protein
MAVPILSVLAGAVGTAGTVGLAIELAMRFGAALCCGGLSSPGLAVSFIVCGIAELVVGDGLILGGGLTPPGLSISAEYGD